MHAVVVGTPYLHVDDLTVESRDEVECVLFDVC